jgi:hypothetical protein
VQRVQEVNCEHLRKEFDEICFKEGEAVDDFSMRIIGLANNITVLGDTICEGEIMKKILHVAPEPLEQRKKKSSSTVDKQGRLLLTEEEWLSRLKIRENSSKGGRSGSRKGGKKTNKPRGKEEAKQGTDEQAHSLPELREEGPLAKDCWSKPKKKDKAHVAQDEEEEPALF